MDNIKIYEIAPKYIDYLSLYAPHLFHNKQKTKPLKGSTLALFFK